MPAIGSWNENKKHELPVSGKSGNENLSTVEGDLTAHKEDEERDEGPEDLLLERDTAFGGCDLREDAHHWADKLEEANHD